MIADAISDQIAAFEKAFQAGAIAVAVVALSVFGGSEREPTILGIKVTGETTYRLTVAFFLMILMTQAIRLLAVASLVKRISAETPNWYIAVFEKNGLLNPLAAYEGRIEALLSAASFGAPIMLWWLMDVSALGVSRISEETGQGPDHSLRLNRPGFAGGSIA